MRPRFMFEPSSRVLFNDVGGALEFACAVVPGASTGSEEVATGGSGGKSALVRAFLALCLRLSSSFIAVPFCSSCNKNEKKRKEDGG